MDNFKTHSPAVCYSGLFPISGIPELQFATTAHQKAAAPKTNTDSGDENFRAFVYLVFGCALFFPTRRIFLLVFSNSLALAATKGGVEISSLFPNSTHPSTAEREIRHLAKSSES